jgi:alpha-D-xyloside xylohydrolase
VHEAAARYARDGGFLFSRSAWAGSQRYPSQWGGDPQADWGGLAASIRGGLSWGMTGAPFYATDVGGFYGDQRDPLLYVRWAQASVWSAHMRLHGIGPREPWSYGAEAERAAMAALPPAALPVACGAAGERDRLAGAARDGAGLPGRTGSLGLRAPVLLR